MVSAIGDKIDGLFTPKIYGPEDLVLIDRILTAIEIEKGSLLRKKQQLREKVEFLNDRYGDRWIVLASNRNLVREYKKYGETSTRRDLHKRIEKWLKN